MTKRLPNVRLNCVIEANLSNITFNVLLFANSSAILYTSSSFLVKSLPLPSILSIMSSVAPPDKPQSYDKLFSLVHVHLKLQLTKLFCKLLLHLNLVK